MKLWIGIAVLVFAATARAEVSVVATVDQKRIALGESVAYTITVRGVQGGVQPVIPKVDGLSFSGPATQTSVVINNNQMTQSLILTYQVTPTRAGEFTIPAIPLDIAGNRYSTEPVTISVEKGAVQEDLKDKLFGRIRFESPQLYLGQTAPLAVELFARQDVPLKGVSGFNFEAEGLGYKFLQNLTQTTRIIDGQAFNVWVIEGAISPTRPGRLQFGPCVLRSQLSVQRRGRSGTGFGFDDPFFQQFFGTAEVRELPVSIDALPIEVLALPEQGRPADFTGAVGQWSLEVSAKPTEVAVGDPITLTVKISGSGNIDTVSTPALAGLDQFKTYDPTSNTTKNELGTTGQRVFQQVLVPKSTDATELPAVRLSYFDPVAKAYKTAAQGPIRLAVKAAGPGASALVAGATRTRPAEKLGEDIVYLKGDLGPVPAAVPFYGSPMFWILNFTPVAALAGLAIWKRRLDRLHSDIAYARRSRAAKRARRLLASAHNYDHIQRALQNYLGDRLNIPASGITASVVEEHGLPKAAAEVFEACDSARFAGTRSRDDDVDATKAKVRELIDDLENTNL
jgi:hypothetical protein